MNYAEKQTVRIFVTFFVCFFCRPVLAMKLPEKITDGTAKDYELFKVFMRVVEIAVKELDEMKEFLGDEKGDEEVDTIKECTFPYGNGLTLTNNCSLLSPWGKTSLYVPDGCSEEKKRWKKLLFIKKFLESKQIKTTILPLPKDKESFCILDSKVNLETFILEEGWNSQLAESQPCISVERSDLEKEVSKKGASTPVLNECYMFDYYIIKVDGCSVDPCKEKAFDFYDGNPLNLCSFKEWAERAEKKGDCFAERYNIEKTPKKERIDFLILNEVLFSHIMTPENQTSVFEKIDRLKY